MAIRSAWEHSAPARRIARRNCAQACRSARLRPTAGRSAKRLVYWSGDWPGAVYWNTSSGARATAGTWWSSNRRLPTIGRRRRSSATPTLSSCRGLRTCDGAAPKWCLESPRAGALFKICDPKIATAMAMLSTPRQIKELRRQKGFPGVELLALLLDCQILFKVGAAGESGLRGAEGDDSLVLWDFHDLLFHARSTEGRHANPLGGAYPHAGVISPLPAVRPSWPGKKIDLRKVSAAFPEAMSPVAKLLRERHSTRDFDDERPITLAELAQFLDGDRARPVEIGMKLRPRRSAVTPPGRILRRAPATSSSSIWPSTNAKGWRAASIITMPAHMRWRRSASRANELEALLKGAESAMGASAAPQILITIAARFGRISWKYSSIAYALILKDVGVLMQTLYLMATDMGLGGCAIGTRISICSQR